MLAPHVLDVRAAMLNLRLMAERSRCNAVHLLAETNVYKIKIAQQLTQLKLITALFTTVQNRLPLIELKDIGIGNKLITASLLELRQKIA